MTLGEDQMLLTSNTKQRRVRDCRNRTLHLDRRVVRTTATASPQQAGDLQLATDVQNRLLPGRHMTISGVKCAAYYRPLHNIGGDYYDFVALDSDRVAFAISDVSGKGISAALVMSHLHASVHITHLLQTGIEPEELVTSLNRVLYESSLANVYASLFYAEYDLRSRIFTYVNAGHTPALVGHRKGTHIAVVPIESDGVPIGISRTPPTGPEGAF